SLPYVSDLVRLAVSAEMALASEKNARNFEASVTAARACDAILAGYTKGMADALEEPDARRPFVLAEKHDWLRTIVVNKLEKKDKVDGTTKFDKIVAELAEGAPPPLTAAVPLAAREALLAAFPPRVPGYPHYRIGRRTAGLGSLGRPRFTAVIDNW